MKRYNVLYYLLFLGVIMGALASMALNAYGMKLLGLSCLGFSFTFVYELFFLLPVRTDLTSVERRVFALELVMLSLLSLLFFFRSFLIEVPFGREVILLVLIILIVLTLLYGWKHFRMTWPMGRVMALGVACYYSSLFLFIVTFLAGVVKPDLATTLGPVGFVFLGGFGVTAWLFKGMVYEGENVTVIRYVRKMKNRSGLLGIGLLLMLFYFGLHQVGMLPSLYSGEMPSGYMELIRKAESGEEKGIGKMKYEQFADEYNKFIGRLGSEGANR